MLIACICNNYTTIVDGKPYIVKNERMVGEISSKAAHVDFDEEKDLYFKGVVFTKAKKKKEQEFEFYSPDGISLTKKEFYERVKTFSEVF